jgi:phosphate transport system substrate-binding protein
MKLNTLSSRASGNGPRAAIRIAAALVCIACGTPPAVKADVTGAGATFVYPVLAAWSSEYHKQTGIKVNYQSIGSGGGIAQIKAATVEFGASERPLSDEELKKFDLLQFPVVIGGISVVVNLPGIKDGELKFTGDLLADIYLGKITTWDDDRIKALNPNSRLPKARITVVSRSDGSGTTFVWTNYLSKVSPEWKQKVGEGTSVSWPTGVGGKGNEGVANYVKRIKNSIGYVEYAYALQNKLTYGLVQNADKTAFLEPYQDHFQAASADADWAKADDFRLILTQQPGAKSYPVTGAVWIMMYKQPKNPAQARQAIEFFNWTLTTGQKIAGDLHYVPMPAATVKLIQNYWRKEFKDPSLKALIK